MRLMSLLMRPDRRAVNDGARSRKRETDAAAGVFHSAPIAGRHERAVFGRTRHRPESAHERIFF
jgi:hypothetical protein